MASKDGNNGIQFFSAASIEALDDLINQFLSGDGTPDDPRKQIVHITNFFLESAYPKNSLCFLHNSMFSFTM